MPTSFEVVECDAYTFTAVLTVDQLPLAVRLAAAAGAALAVPVKVSAVMAAAQVMARLLNLQALQPAIYLVGCEQGISARITSQVGRIAVSTGEGE